MDGVSLDPNWEPEEGCTFRHNGEDIPVREGFVLLQFAVWHAHVAGADLVFWAGADEDHVCIEGATKDASTEIGLERSLFNGCFSENLRCGTVFGSSEQLCLFLATSGLCGTGVRVLELGAGSGLPGLWAASKGCEVVLTDQLSATLELLTRSTHLIEAGSASVRELAWGDASPPWLKDFDLVLASEVIYGPGMERTFFTSAAHALRPGGSLVLSHKYRFNCCERMSAMLSSVRLPTVNVESDVLPWADNLGLKLISRQVVSVIAGTIECFHFLKPDVVGV